MVTSIIEVIETMIFFINDNGDHISIPNHLECVIARRLIKENNLIIDIKRRK